MLFSSVYIWFCFAEAGVAAVVEVAVAVAVVVAAADDDGPVKLSLVAIGLPTYSTFYTSNTVKIGNLLTLLFLSSLVASLS
jgi:hypothetical protein